MNEEKNDIFSPLLLYIEFFLFLFLHTKRVIKRENGTEKEKGKRRTRKKKEQSKEVKTAERLKRKKRKKEKKDIAC